jgi:hypothetical protein
MEEARRHLILTSSIKEVFVKMPVKRPYRFSDNKELEVNEIIIVNPSEETINKIKDLCHFRET